MVNSQTPCPYHRQNRRFVNPVGQRELYIKLRVRRPEGQEEAPPGVCRVWYLDSGRWLSAGLSLTASLYRYNYFQVKLGLTHPTISYLFQIGSGITTWWLDSVGREPGSQPGRKLIPFVFSWDPAKVFSTPAWSQGAIFYQIFPDRFYNGNPDNDPPGTESWGANPNRVNFFGGDLAGITAKAGYLRQLGVEAVWLNPIFAATSNHRYNTSDYKQLDPVLGDLDDFRQMLRVLHAHGIKVILDGVFNHTGTDFWAFRDIIERGRESPFLDWYFIYDLPIRCNPPNYACWWNFAELPKLNVQNPRVRRYLLEVAAYWTNLGIDGWRLDVPNEIEGDFWEEFRRLIKHINPDAYLAGEIWSDGLPWLRGNQFDAVMNYPFQDTILDCFARRKISLAALDYRLGRMRLRYPEQAGACLLNLLDSHDTARVLTKFRETTPGGDLRQAMRRLRPAVILQATYPGSPLIYYGDEVGMEGGPDPDCRRTMVWEPQEQNRELISLYRCLALARKNNAALKGGLFQRFLLDEEKGLYGFTRRLGEQAAIVVINIGDKPANLEIPLESLDLPAKLSSSCWHDILHGGMVSVIQPAATRRKLACNLPGHDGLLLLPGRDCGVCIITNSSA